MKDFFEDYRKGPWEIFGLFLMSLVSEEARLRLQMIKNNKQAYKVSHQYSELRKELSEVQAVVDEHNSPDSVLQPALEFLRIKYQLVREASVLVDFYKRAVTMLLGSTQSPEVKTIIDGHIYRACLLSPCFTLQELQWTERFRNMRTVGDFMRYMSSCVHPGYSDMIENVIAIKGKSVFDGVMDVPLSESVTQLENCLLDGVHSWVPPNANNLWKPTCKYCGCHEAEKSRA